MKNSMQMKTAQSLNMTPQLLQSIRLLQLNTLQMEMELRQALERNPLLEDDDDHAIGETAIDEPAEQAEAEMAAWDELPDPAFLSGGQSGIGFDDDGMARIAESESSDPRLRLLDQLRLELPAETLALAAWWLDRCDDRGYLEGDLAEVLDHGVAELGIARSTLEIARLRLLNGPEPGVAACGPAECLSAQLRQLPADADQALARQIVEQHIDLLASHDRSGLAAALNVDEAAISRAFGLIAVLQAHPFAAPSMATDIIIPDVVAWQADGGWRVALNDRSLPRLRVSPHCEHALSGQGGAGHGEMRGLLDEARWLLRGIAMRNDTLLRTTRVLVERQAAYLSEGEEALAPLTLREVAEAIEMHESTVSRITTGKYIQTPRGTLELKKFFAVQLDGAEVSGAAVRAMVKRIIEAEPAAAPLSDDHVAAMLARDGVNIARRTVAKYRDQLHILPVRARARAYRTQDRQPLSALR